MRRYQEFHGDIAPSQIEQRLREIVRTEKCFKIVTGYGASTGRHVCKTAALSALARLKREGKIKGYISGEKITELITNPRDPDAAVKEQYRSLLFSDPDRGNDGVIFIFVK